MKLRRVMCGVLAVSLASASVYLPTAQAALVGTGEAVQALQGETAARDRLATLLQREDVQARLAQLGVDPDEARQRAAALSDEEVAQLARHMDQLPAGGDVLGLAVFVFFVLLLTDILGYTDIFPFVTKTVEGKKK